MTVATKPIIFKLCPLSLTVVNGLLAQPQRQA